MPGKRLDEANCSCHTLASWALKPEGLTQPQCLTLEYQVAVIAAAVCEGLGGGGGLYLLSSAHVWSHSAVSLHVCVPPKDNHLS